MHERDLFKNISPLDHRYYLANREIFDRLSLYISEEAGVVYCVKAEVALLKAHFRLSVPERKDLLSIVDRLVDLITPEEVYQEEEKTRHNIRALVNVMKSKLPAEIQYLVHLGATSADILDTATSLKVKDAVRNVILPLLIEVEEQLAKLAGDYAATPQVGRTHGQHAVPITFGFAMAEYVSRLGKSVVRVEGLSRELKGKLSGAVGAYNGTSLITQEPEELERLYLGFLGLEPSEHSTQLVEPEYLLRLLLEINIAFGIIANLADDLRHLQRSEIAEVKEFFTATQVGSSTMPQKRNPWNSEHIKSLWKAFSPRVLTFFMDQISEHQRDLTNSASSRFIAEYLGGFTAAVKRTQEVLSHLFVDKEKLMENLWLTKDLVLAEAIYILLATCGETDAHEIIRTMTLRCEKSGKTLLDVLQESEQYWHPLENQLKKTYGVTAEEFFRNPALYRGRAREKAQRLAVKYSREMKNLTRQLKME